MNKHFNICSQFTLKVYKIKNKKIKEAATTDLTGGIPVLLSILKGREHFSC
jgi:hypothetical protein